VLLTQAPGVMGVTPPPSAVRKNDLVPDPLCGRNAAMVAFGPGGVSWSQLVTLHS
jgi:hypothetical protein